MIGLTSCDEEHVHSYGEWKIQEKATCTEKGIRVKTCECEHEIEEEIPATGHNFVGGVCTDCGVEQ